MSLPKIILSTFVILIIASGAFAGADNELAQAVEADQVVFLLVYEPGVSGLEQAQNLINSSIDQIENAISIKLIRSDPANSALVKKYGVTGAPLPLILIFARNGAMAGGILANQASADKLVKMVPSLKKADVLKILQSGSSVLISASTPGMSDESNVLSSCQSTCGELKGKCEIVIIDLTDQSEETFLKELKIDPNASKPVTIVINSQGQLTGKFDGPVEVGQLVQAATKKVSSGCCPPSSGKTCAPTKTTTDKKGQ